MGYKGIEGGVVLGFFCFGILGCLVLFLLIEYYSYKISLFYIVEFSSGIFIYLNLREIFKRNIFKELF